MSTSVPSTLVNTPKTNTSCGTSLAGEAVSQSNGYDLIETPNQQVCGGTIYVGDVDAGVEAIQVGEQQADGIVTLRGGGLTTVSMSGSTVTVSSQAGPVGGASSLKELTDVVLATDVEGNVIETDGAWLQFNNDQTHPYYRFWTATCTLDGGPY